jgi:prophage regulatory protein
MATNGVNVTPEPPRLLNATGVAALLNVSSRSVYRLADAGRMPQPLKVGGSVRWDRQAVEQWVADGCPAVAPRKRGGSRNGP